MSRTGFGQTALTVGCGDAPLNRGIGSLKALADENILKDVVSSHVEGMSRGTLQRIDCL